MHRHSKTTPENMECGVRFKFAPVRRDVRPRFYPEMAELARWCSIFDVEGMAPVEGGASLGNLSFRTVGASDHADAVALKSDIPWENFVEVVRSNWLDFEVSFFGAHPPSSDAFLHDRIYAIRPDVSAVFHGHDDVVLECADQLGREFPIAVTSDALLFGTKKDAEQTARELGTRSYIIRKGHGFLAVGKTMEEAGQWSLKIHRRASEILAGR